MAGGRDGGRLVSLSRHGLNGGLETKDRAGFYSTPGTVARVETHNRGSELIIFGGRICRWHRVMEPAVLSAMREIEPVRRRGPGNGRSVEIFHPSTAVERMTG